MSNQRMAFFGGAFVAEENARLHVSDLSIQRGYGAFDFFRVINNTPVFMEEHLDRFFRSAALLNLEIGLDRPKLQSIIFELIERNNISFSGIKLTVTGGYSPDGFTMQSPNLFITQQALLPRSPQMVEQGIKVITYQHVREQPEIKSINYLTAMLLQETLLKARVDEVLYHQHGEVSEFPRSNFFIVTKDDVVATPAKNILPGITRSKVLELAAQQYATAETVVTLADIRNAKEAFLTSTTRQVIPVIQIDDLVIGDGKPGNITRQLDVQVQELISTVVNETQQVAR